VAKIFLKDDFERNDIEKNENFDDSEMSENSNQNPLFTVNLTQ
jgi:hypothetical protein